MTISDLPLLYRLGQSISLLPFASLFAAMNALGEELTFRAPLLATSHEIIGRQSALWMTSIYFGLAPYLYGDPSGMIGFLLTAFIAYLLGKSMLETRGIFWAWFIHFMADIPIFLLYALKSV
jgi:membrane protease YdiL (CAAX protease family)